MAAEKLRVWHLTVLVRWGDNLVRPRGEATLDGRLIRGAALRRELVRELRQRDVVLERLMMEDVVLD